MHAITVTQTGGPEVLTYGELPDPQPAPDQLLVATEAVGINFIDTYFRAGVYPRPTPFVPGKEGAGVVTAVGEQVRGFSVGDRVAWADAPGSYAEQVAVPAAVAAPIPADLDAAVAASALLQGMTAHYLVETIYCPRPGESVLVHAGAGGVGLILTQLAAAKGARVITTVSSDEKEALSREAGAADVLRYHDDLAKQVRALTNGVGVAAVYDGVGKATFDASLDSLRVRGMLALFGGSSGQVPPFDPQRLRLGGSLLLTRPDLADYIRDRDEFLWRAGDILRGITTGALRVRVGARYRLSEAERAHRDLEARRTAGSVVLLPDVGAQVDSPS